jgi:hypothetical protein
MKGMLCSGTSKAIPEDGAPGFEVASTDVWLLFPSMGIISMLFDVS